jgi:hypothetical protein
MPASEKIANEKVAVQIAPRARSCARDRFAAGARRGWTAQRESVEQAADSGHHRCAQVRARSAWCPDARLGVSGRVANVARPAAERARRIRANRRGTEDTAARVRDPSPRDRRLLVLASGLATEYSFPS